MSVILSTSGWVGGQILANEAFSFKHGPQRSKLFLLRVNHIENIGGNAGGGWGANSGRRRLFVQTGVPKEKII